MTYDRNELSTFTLQKLASLYPQNMEEEVLLKEIFDKRASVSSYLELTALVDIKNGWQETIIQHYVDIKRETMPVENPATLSPEDESKLDASVVTKETELELQDKLDTANAKRKEAAAGTEVVDDVVSADTESPQEEPKKRGRKPKI